MIPFFRRPLRPRLALVGVGIATITVAACDTSSSFAPDQRLWSFVTIGALRTSAGEYRVAPTAVFFRGAISTIPDASTRPDSCYPTAAYVAPTNVFTGVTYLDAGAAVTTTIGGVATELPRTQSNGALSYSLGANTVAYRPGDSVIVAVPGAAGGYPGFTARGKTAEAFTIEPINPSSGGFVPLRWTAASDGNSALVLSLQYTPANSSTRMEIRCAFVDDGVDSIAPRFHALWSNSSNTSRSVTATRLRTLIAGVGDGAFELISTFAVPTPTP
jgi:hypothetical protein